MVEHKKNGILSFKRGKFKNAALLFSLAYEQQPDEKLLFFIELCDFASKNENEAKMLFELISSPKSKISKEEFDELMSELEIKATQNEAINEQDAIGYGEFIQMVRASDFKSAFENVMFSTKVMISNKDDFLDFIQNLIKHGFVEMSIGYLESAAKMFSGDERLGALWREIQKRQNENIR